VYPGRRYWIWSFVVWLVLTLGLFAYIAWGPFFRGPVYWTAVSPWLGFFTPLFFFVAFVIGLAVNARRGADRSGSEWRGFVAWVMLGLTTAAAAVEFGPVMLLPAVAVAAWLVHRRGMRRSAYGVMGGLGSLLILSMVWWDARTPHECQAVPHEPNAFSCPNHTHFVAPTVLGVVLLVTGVVAQRRRREQRPASY
jgi:hypothetical protein